MSRNIPSLRMRVLAQQLIAHEVSSETLPIRHMDAVARVFEDLRRPLCTLVGVSGLRALLARALTLARGQVDGLKVVTVEAEASLIGLDKLRNQDDPEGGIVFLAQLLGLLGAFIGESLTMNILSNTWPNLAALNTQATQEEKKNDATR